MKIHHTNDISAYSRYTTQELRERYLLEKLFEDGKINLIYTDIDRAIVGAAVPNDEKLSLPADKKNLGAEYFCERRELGIINMGGDGVISVDGHDYDMANRSSLYVGRGAKSVEFLTHDTSNPAKFFLTSYPAHQDYPTRLIPKDKAKKVELGSPDTCNERIIYQSLVPGIVDTCQIVMGFTEIAKGSNWNTFPAHTHLRRMEVYAYFELEDDQAVFHMMGEPQETRHLLMRNGDAVVSPSWSIHSGVGTSSYTFIWAMGGENQIFDDMDHVKVKDLL